MLPVPEPCSRCRTWERRMATRILISAFALSTVVGLVVVPPAAPAAEVDYSVSVDATGAGPEISDTMYGIFVEDINRAADGGLYAELVQNRSFEYDPVDNSSFTPLTGWAPK